MPLVSYRPGQPPSDAELLSAARAGDASALGLMLERHRPGLFALALRLLGHRSDAEDAVQETCLAAMQHLGAIRDPGAVQGWLRSVLRRTCLQHRRRQSRIVPSDVLPERADDGAGPEDRLERLELREWIWAALQRLPEPLRLTAMLRYFGSYSSYDELAGQLGVPIGTVRSRLAQVRLTLSQALLASGRALDGDLLAVARERERFWTDAIQEIFRRGDSSAFVRHFASDLVVAWSAGVTARGRDHLAAEIEGDLAAGVRLDPERVLSSDGLVVVEGRFVNPPEAPEHCPPGIALILLGHSDRPGRVRLHLSPRPPLPESE